VQVAVITGEASGDRAGAQIVREMRALRPDWTFWGTGGKYLRGAGAEVFIDSAKWGVVGIAQGMMILPEVLRARAELHRELLKRKPDLLVTVDAGAFNVGFGPIEGLCPWARRNLPGTKIFYFYPPGSWRRTLTRTPLAGITDAVATPFPWSETELRRFGVNATFVGHPLLDIVRPSMSPEEFAAKWRIDREHPVVGILPGSRAQEIAHILPVQLGAAAVIRHRVPSVHFLLALAPTVDRGMVEKVIDRVNAQVAAQQAADRRAREGRGDGNGAGGALGAAVPVSTGGQTIPPDELARRQREWMRRAAEMPRPPEGPLPLTIVEDAAYDVMAASDVLLAASGTATLEAAILGKPMVISYRMSKLNYPQYLAVKDKLPKYIGLPNLLADRQIVPELLHDDATPEAMATPVIDYLLEPDRMLRTREDLQQVVALLGEPGGAARAAKLAVELAESGRRERPAAAEGT
jgi:lipid-A-disaccharide synthase